MAGRGTRLRPQTLTTPKPLINIAGKTIIERILNVIINNSKKKINNIGFIIEGENPPIEERLHALSKSKNISPHTFFQDTPKGTAHAIYCARKILKGPTLIVFADTLFDTSLVFPDLSDGCVFVQEVVDPSSYGVVMVGKNGQITDFVEKPSKNISNLAMVGIYYFKEGGILLKEIKNILDNNIMIKGEYQITTALENLKKQRFIFTPHKIKSWYDFGTPENLLNSHAEILKKDSKKKDSKKNKKLTNTTIIQPCHIDKSAIISNSTIGPLVSVGPGSKIKNSKIKNSIIQNDTMIDGAQIQESIIGSHVEYNKNFKQVNIGDYSTFK